MCRMIWHTVNHPAHDQILEYMTKILEDMTKTLGVKIKILEVMAKI